jgi:hypothetical protein
MRRPSHSGNGATKQDQAEKISEHRLSKITKALAKKEGRMPAEVEAGQD